MSSGAGLAVITGAASGMGAEFARQLGAQGYDLILLARRRDRLEQVRDGITAIHNVQCEVLPADLINPDELAGVEARLRTAANLSLLVNNAGFGSSGKFYESSIDEQDQMHRLHVLATMRLCHAALGGMVARNRGAIINVSSVSAFVPTAGTTSYSATKAWMNRFSEGLYLELRAARSAVRVQALCPGYTRTEFHSASDMNVRGIPNWMWLSAERVVRESLRGLRQGKLIVIPGRFYRYSVRMYRMLPPSAKDRVGLGSAAFRSSIGK